MQRRLEVGRSAERAEVGRRDVRTRAASCGLDSAKRPGAPARSAGGRRARRRRDGPPAFGDAYARSAPSSIPDRDGGPRRSTPYGPPPAAVGAAPAVRRAGPVRVLLAPLPWRVRGGPPASGAANASAAAGRGRRRPQVQRVASHPPSRPGRPAGRSAQERSPAPAGRPGRCPPRSGGRRRRAFGLLGRVIRAPNQRLSDRLSVNPPRPASSCRSVPRPACGRARRVPPNSPAPEPDAPSPRSRRTGRAARSPHLRLEDADAPRLASCVEGRVVRVEPVATPDQALVQLALVRLALRPRRRRPAARLSASARLDSRHRAGRAPGRPARPGSAGRARRRSRPASRPRTARSGRARPGWRQGSRWSGSCRCRAGPTRRVAAPRRRRLMA